VRVRVWGGPASWDEELLTLAIPAEDGHSLSMRGIAVVDRAGLTEAELRQLEAALVRHASLDRVVAWALAQTPPRMIADVVVQDEYTHDVVVPHEDGRYLVYDTT
jgi:hypothetical protein